MRGKKRNIKLIIFLLCIFSLMTIAYAAFSTTLNIKGTSQINSKWDIQITSISSGTITGNAENTKTPVYNSTVATFEADLYEKGDAIEYEVTIENKGTFDAVLENIDLQNSNNPAIKITTSGISKGDKLFKNTSIKMKVKIEYDNNFTGSLTSTVGEGTINLNYVQASGNVHSGTNCFTTTENSDGTLSITDYDIACGSDVIIPDYIDGKAVTKIVEGNADSGIPVGVFSSKNIKSVKFSDTITTIGYAAFYNNQIQTLNIPSNITTVNIYAFYHNQIDNLTLNEGNVTLGAWAFANNSISSLKIPSTVTYIGEAAFYTNLLTNIDVPMSVKTIDGGAFNRNKVTNNSKYIYKRNNGIEDKTTLISYAGSVADSTIPDNITKLGTLSYYAIDVSKLTLNNNIIEIGKNAFRYSNLSGNINIPDSVQTIGETAFSKCESITDFTIGSGIKTIASNALMANDNIKTITINRKANAVTGSPWGAKNATVSWSGTN